MKFDNKTKMFDTRKINLKNVRYFNTIKIVDNGKSVLKKYSGEDQYYKEKFFDEIIWMLKLELYSKNNVPKIIDYSLSKDNLWIKTEFLPFKTIHDHYVNNDQINWKLLVECYIKFINKLSKYKPKYFIRDEWKEKLIEFYLKRTVKNIESVAYKNDLSVFFNRDYIFINDEKYPSLKVIVSFIKNKIRLLQKNELQKNDLFYTLCNVEKNRVFFTHLDLIFGNVFLDEKNESIKVIDPRGSFADSKEFGDIYYDYAKIYQCIYGLYDFVVEDKFDISFGEDDKIYFDVYEPKNIHTIKREFDALFSKVNIDIVKLIESIQFFAMLPAHNDNENRQIAQILIGITHFYSLFGDKISTH